MTTCTTRDGKVLADGSTVRGLVLAHGVYEQVHEDRGVGKKGDPVERVVDGTIRAFEQDGEIRWEVVTGDPQYPAIGFLPENALTRTGD